VFKPNSTHPSKQDDWKAERMFLQQENKHFSHVFNFWNNCIIGT